MFILNILCLNFHEKLVPWALFGVAIKREWDFCSVFRTKMCQQIDIIRFNSDFLAKIKKVAVMIDNKRTPENCVQMSESCLQWGNTRVTFFQKFKKVTILIQSVILCYYMFKQRGGGPVF